MLRLPDHWVWDSWVVDDGARFHLFFLRASRALLDEHRRHLNASVGHAVSDDLTTWELLPDALVPSDPPGWDDRAIWTGSTVRGDDGQWHLLYTARGHGNPQQRIGHATSSDLITWHRAPGRPGPDGRPVGDGYVSEADPRWYEQEADGFRPGDEAWRDPWVLHHEGRWHMLVTARLRHGDEDRARGTVGHATSPDLFTWTTQPPLTGPTPFGELEVTQVECIETDDGRAAWVLVFGTAARHVDPASGLPARSGVYTAPADGPLGPYHLDRAEVIGDGAVYAGHLVRDRSNRWVLLGFVHDDFAERGGWICDPIPVQLTERGTVQPA